MTQPLVRRISAHVADTVAHAPLFVFWLILWVSYYGIVLLVHSKALYATPLHDDVAMPLYFQPVRQFGWIDCFCPMDNGFLRPLTMLTFFSVWKLAGTAPLLYHLVSAAIHSAVAASAATAFCVVTRAPRIAGAAIGLSVAMASAAFAIVYVLTNSGDSFMALGVLLVVTFWALWLHRAEWKYICCTALAAIFALAGKETAVALAGIILLQTLVTPLRKERRLWTWIAVVAMILLCVGYGLLIIWLQKKTNLSYTTSGMTTFHPVAILKRTFGYIVATVFPETYIMTPFRPVPESAKWALRAGSFAAVIVAAVAVFVRAWNPGFRAAAFFLLSAVGVLLPSSVLLTPPTGRYAYAAIPLIILAIGCVILPLWVYRRRLVRLGLTGTWAVWLLWQVLMVRKSPGAYEYYQPSREYKNLVDEMARVSATWPPMQGVAFFTGPPHGSVYISEPYGAAIMRVYFPNLLAAYFSNRTPPETTRAYVFDGKRLKPVPVP